MQNNKGMRYSAILHGVMLLFLLFGLPGFLEPKPDPTPMAMSVDILPVAPISNVKPQEKTPDKPDQKKPVEEQKTEKKATTEAKKEEVVKPEAVPLPTPLKPEIKKPEKKEPPKKVEKKPKEEDLDSILKSVKETAKASESKKPTESKSPPKQNAAKSDHYDATMPLSLSETDAIRQQIEKKWDAPIGAKDASNLALTLRVELNEDGSVISVELARDQGRYNSDSFFRAAVDSAIRAVKMASPLKMPTGRYSDWRVMELGFDPKDALF